MKGNQFSSGLRVISSKTEQTIVNRLEICDNLFKGNKVIHLGCCDHIPLIEEKRNNNLWLHSRIIEKANRCLGIDINENGIKYLQSKLGYKDLVCADIQKDNISEIINETWDFIFLGEILEHVDNPVGLLIDIREKYSKVIDKMVVSVPNAFRYMNFVSSKNHSEIINSDHRFWFSPYTLAKVFTVAGYNIEEYFLCMAAPIKLNFRRKLRTKYRRLLKYPLYRDTIFMIAEL